MVYVGSKREIASKIVRLITLNLKPGGTYIEPFCGGCNVAKNLPPLTYKVKLSDYNKCLISLLQKCQSGYIPPIEPPTKEEYERIRKLKNEEPALAGEYGFLLGFRGAFYCGYCYKDPETGYNYYQAKRTALLDTISKIKEFEISFSNYRDLVLPDDKENTLIYCDIPYKKDRNRMDIYGGNSSMFSHYEYWNWVREKSKQGHRIITSENTAPEDFISIYDIPHIHQVRGSERHQVTESIFVLKGTEKNYKTIRAGIEF